MSGSTMVARCGAAAEAEDDAKTVDRLFSDAALAEVYDQWHPRSCRSDYDFYLPLIMAADSVLDLGCGTGTMLAEARAAGHRGMLRGLDPATGMLQIAKRHTGVEWVLGHTASVCWPEAFDLIVMTGHAFQTIIEDDELLAFAASVRDMLKPGGRFAFDTRNPAHRAWQSWRPDLPTTVRMADGDEVQITTRVTAPFDGRAVTFAHTFAGPGLVAPAESRSTLRFLDATQVASLMAAAELEMEAQLGDFGGGPVAAHSPEIVTLARRPAQSPKASA